MTVSSDEFLPLTKEREAALKNHPAATPVPTPPKTIVTAQGQELDNIANARGTGRRQKPTDTGHMLETDLELRGRVEKF